MRLPDPHRSTAVLIGTATYRFADLPDLPAVVNNLHALNVVLTDPALGGLLAKNTTVLADPTDVRTVYRLLRRSAMTTEDTLLVYFAGHGRTGPRNELYLCLKNTDPDELPVSALPFDLVREILGDSPADNRILILDCCFSGRAIGDMGGDEAILGQIGITGTYTLTATPANAVALAPIGATYTAFTGELLTLLRTGLPGGPEVLTFGDIYRRLLRTMTTRGLPKPHRRATGTVDALGMTRNPAYSGTISPSTAVSGPGNSADTPTSVDISTPGSQGTPPPRAADAAGRIDTERRRSEDRQGTVVGQQYPYPATPGDEVDLTACARDGKLDPVIGRDSEIRRLIQVLGRRTRNNPLLIGERGIGKTAIVEGLAQRIAAADVPKWLRDTPLVAIDPRGRAIDAIERTRHSHDQILVFIDDLHMLFGGTSEGSQTGAGTGLNAMLAHGELHMVGTISPAGYREYIERDPTLERCFEPIVVGQPTVQDTISILRILKRRYEDHHMVRITNAALVAAAVLSDRHITNQFLPAKAIDLIDEAASQLRIEIDSGPIEVDQIQRRMRHLEIEIKEMEHAAERDPARAGRLERLRVELTERGQQLAELVERWRAERDRVRTVSTINEKPQRLRTQATQAEHDAELRRAAQSSQHQIPRLERELAAIQANQTTRQVDGAMLREEVTAYDVAALLATRTGIAAEQLLNSEATQM